MLLLLTILDFILRVLYNRIKWIVLRKISIKHRKRSLFKMITLSDEAKAARRAYKRQWAQKNPDKVQAQQKRYWERQALKIRQEPPAGNAKEVKTP